MEGGKFDPLELLGKHLGRSSDDGFELDYYVRHERNNRKKALVCSWKVLVFLYLTVWAVIFFLFSSQRNIFGASEDAQCFASRDADRNWTVWASMPAIQADKVVNVRESMQTWAWLGSILFTFANLLNLQTWCNKRSCPLESLLVLLSLILFVVWNVWGAIIRYGPAGAACTAIFLQAEGNLFDWYYGVLLLVLAPVFGLCCLFAYLCTCLFDSRR